MPSDPADHEGPAPSEADELPALVGQNLRRLRVRRGHSLERLARISGVSRAMISQIETGRSTPTISTLWKLSTALATPFSALISAQGSSELQALRRENAKVLAASDGRFTSRALFPFEAARRVEFYELTIAPRHTEHAEAHAPGTRENIVVTAGVLEIMVEGERPVALGEGDAILFAADKAHAYRNLGDATAVAYLVMTYVEDVG